MQSGTSHFLGQNFAKAFDVKFQTADQTSDYVWATSWGVRYATSVCGLKLLVYEALSY
jgi:prolyl-tRNA synthetase